MYLLKITFPLLAAHIGLAGAFVAPSGRVNAVTEVAAYKGIKSSSDVNCFRNSLNRRAVLSKILTTTVASTGAASLIPSQAFAEAETMERGGVPLTPFNSLAFNYRGGGSPTLDANTLNEPSVSYSEFLEKLNADQVSYVEFLAPNGDAAYVTFKASETGKDVKPVRIGEGYPLEDPEGWSSPAFVVKAVAKKGVPYKFVVPGLTKYN
mmetsp:Transcript_16765/g.35209  ORF Transcript_16765/g.35209 Transcript_16765/m.35209 type:complete len:208 (-) Transcript_16765:344-967(-)